MCWHKYGKWLDFREGKIIRDSQVLGYTPWNGETRFDTIGTFIEQQKECSKCGKKKLRTVKTKL